MRKTSILCSSGINIVGVRYEDMAENPERAFAAIFEHCGLSHDPKAVEGAFSRDSQRDSPLSMKNLGKYKVDGFTDEVKKQTDRVCDSFGVREKYILCKPFIKSYDFLLIKKGIK